MSTFGPTAALIAIPIVVVGGLMAAWAIWSSRAGTAQIEVGRALYAEHCASCHGADLKGEPDWQIPKSNGRMPAPPHDASGHTWHHSDAELFRITKFGVSAVVPGYKSDMPGFRGLLSDQEIEAVLEFLKSTWPAREREYQHRRTESAKGGAK